MRASPAVQPTRTRPHPFPRRARGEGAPLARGAAQLWRPQPEQRSGSDSCLALGRPPRGPPPPPLPRPGGRGRSRTLQRAAAAHMGSPRRRLTCSAVPHVSLPAVALQPPGSKPCAICSGGFSASCRDPGIPDVQAQLRKMRQREDSEIWLSY